MMDYLVNYLVEVSDKNMILTVVLFIAIRTSSIVIPPILGFVIDTAGITIFGWFRGFIYAEIGIMLGAIIAFSFTRHFRESIFAKLPMTSKIFYWERYLSGKETLLAWIAIRLPTNPVFDLINYAAGLSKVRLSHFVISTFLGNIPSVFIFFYLGGKGLEYGGLNIYFLVVSTLLAFTLIVYKLWNRKNSN